MLCLGTAVQASSLIDAGLEVGRFLLLHANQNELIDRVSGRRIDPVTGAIYHLKLNPPKDETITARLQQRKDDTEQVIR